MVDATGARARKVRAPIAFSRPALPTATEKELSPRARPAARTLCRRRRGGRCRLPDRADRDGRTRSSRRSPPRAAAAPHGLRRGRRAHPAQGGAARRRGRDHRVEHLRVRAAHLLRPGPRGHRLRARHDPRRRDPPQAAGAHRVQRRAVRHHRRRRRRRAVGAQRPPAPGRPDRPRARRPARHRRRRARLPRAELELRRRRDRARREDRLPPLPRLRPLPAGLDRRPAARPLAGARDRRRLLARRAAAAVPAAAGDPPRRPPGDRQGAPVAARRAHRPAEPRAVPRPRPAGACAPPSAATAAWP